MKILEIKSLAIPEIKIIRFARFCDDRGYFSEPFRKSDFIHIPELAFMQELEIVQTNESYSGKNTIRGLHFQWNPYMGKLVRTLYGNMVDLALDIRKDSPTFGKIIAYEMPNHSKAEFSEWIWVPPGFAHGNYFPKESVIEYFCTGEYSPGCEAGISPFSEDIDWSLCNTKLKQGFLEVSKHAIITDKDKNALTVSHWDRDKRSENFVYPKANSG